MKLLSLSLFFLVLFISPAAGDGYSLHFPAKEVVSEVRTYNWTSAKGWFEGQVTKIIKETFDDEGRLVLVEFFYKDMVPAEVTTLSYKKNMIKKTTRNHARELIRNVLIENEGNTRTETVLRSNGGLFYKTVSMLGSDGEIREQSYYNGDEQLAYIKTFEYTGTGDVKKIHLYNPDNSLAVIIDIVYDEYDDNGNWIARSEYYTYGDVWGRPRDSVRRTILYGGEDDE